MDHHELARYSLLFFCVVQGSATIALDLNRTHAAHPRWLGHARFHVVWQTASVAVLAGLEMLLLLAAGPLEEQRFTLALVLAAVPVVGFFAALVTRSIYGGTLSDPEGIPPFEVRVGSRRIRVDGNLAMEVVGALALAIIAAIYFRGA